MKINNLTKGDLCWHPSVGLVMIAGRYDRTRSTLVRFWRPGDPVVKTAGYTFVDELELSEHTEADWESEVGMSLLRDLDE